MKKLPVAVSISAGVHALVVTAALAYRPPPPEAPVLAREAIEVLTVTDEPVAVVLLDTYSVPMISAAPTEPTMEHPAAPRATAAIATAPTAPTTVIVEPGGEPDRRAPHAMFQMRGGTADQRAAVFSFKLPAYDAIERAPAGTKPIDEVPVTGKLQPNGGGTYRSNEGVFTARVEKDGSVNLEDAKNLNLKFWPDPRKIPKIPKAIGKGVADWYAKEDKAPRDPDREPINNSRSVDKDTRPDHGQTTTVPILGGSFDITDAFMRKKKVDPYASKKLAYLDSTRDERVQIGKRHRNGQLRQSTELMQKQLDVVWTGTATIAQKKQALFELWDDCAETGDARVVEAGREARLLVIGFIRAKFPAGTAHAFTTDELATLARKRTSKTAFEPYR